MQNYIPMHYLFLLWKWFKITFWISSKRKKQKMDHCIVKRIILYLVFHAALFWNPSCLKFFHVTCFWNMRVVVSLNIQIMQHLKCCKQSLRKYSLHIRSFSGQYFPAFGLSTDQKNSEYRHFSRIKYSRSNEESYQY